MDLLTKNLITKASAYNQAFTEIFEQDNTINHAEVEYLEDSDINGKFVRAYHSEIGYSSKFYYA